MLIFQTDFYSYRSEVTNAKTVTANFLERLVTGVESGLTTSHDIGAGVVVPSSSNAASGKDRKKKAKR